ncbi:MAG: thiamine pyrophosphate-binding protein [Kouleothrix sp.]
MPNQRTGAMQILCEALIRENVEVMFGIPGGAIMPFYYAMREYRDQLRYKGAAEQGAGHAAEGYARLIGKVGVCRHQRPRRELTRSRRSPTR